jgi:hypothetical protein
MRQSFDRIFRLDLRARASRCWRPQGDPEPMTRRPPPQWWDRHEPNLILTPTRMLRGAAIVLGPGLETFPDLPLHALWALAQRRAVVGARTRLPDRLPPSAARALAELLEPLVPEVCWTESDGDAWDRTAPYFALLRSGRTVSIALGPDRTTAWLADQRARRSA